MQVLIDADGCPVVDETIALAKLYGWECLILCDTSHFFEREGAKTLTFDRGADSVDFALVNLAQAGDVVVTQDYGLAAMCLAKRAKVINQNGQYYTEANIDALLLARHTARIIRSQGKYPKGPAKRRATQNQAFVLALSKLLRQEEPELGC